MKNPKTKEEAKATLYNRWAGNTKGTPHDEKYCAAEIHEQGRGGFFRQCSNKPGHGPDGLYCSSHAKQLFPGAGVTWYQTGKWSPTGITEVPVTDETDRFIWINGRKRSKSDQWHAYWPTYEAACNHLISKAKSEIGMAELAIKQNTNAINELRAALAARKELK